MKMKAWQKILTGAVAAALLVTSFHAVTFQRETFAAHPDLKLWYDEPSSQGQNILGGGGFGTTNEDNTWQQQTLPIGNSYMGANVYGEIGREQLTFNQKTLWNGGPSNRRPGYNGGNQEHGADYKRIVELYKQGKDAEANDLANRTLVGDVAGYGAYQSWGDIYVDFGLEAGKATNYNRGLDLETALATVDFDYEGTQMHREYFASYVDNVIAMKFTAKGSQKLDFVVSFPVDNAEGVQGRNLGKNVTTTAAGDTIIVAGEMQDNQLKMNGQLKVVIPAGKGTVRPVEGDKLQVLGAEEAVIYVSADTDYMNQYPVYRTGETDAQLAARVAERLDNVSAMTYEQVKERHLNDYQEIFSRVELDLGQTTSQKTTDQLLAGYKNNSNSEAESRQLEVMLFQFGRYLTISSSRENDLPSNLQGVWQNRVGDHNRVPWGSDYHMNVNLQMNYWPTYSTNMAECAKPLVDYVYSLMEPGKVTAKSYFGVTEGGFTAHTQNTPFGWTCPGWNFSWGWSPAALPWILQNCWEYYEYTGDVEYMEEHLYPMLKESALLYDQILFEKDGRLVSAPAYSPEHGPVTAGNTYEQSLIWQLYEDVITAAEVLGDPDGKVAQWKETQSKLHPIEVGTSGQIKEWYTETSLGSVPGYQNGHRHMSHLLGLFPGDLISVDNPEFMNAAKVSLRTRGYKSTGWGMGQRINAWARTGDGNQAHDLIRNLFNDGIYPNLWDSHAPFQIDGNFGYTSGVAEMLMQSNMGYINMLPSLPDEWAAGSVKGLLTRGNFELSMKWSNKRLTEATVLSNKGGDAAVQIAGAKSITVKDASGKTIQATPVEGKAGRFTFPTEVNGLYTITPNF